MRLRRSPPVIGNALPIIPMTPNCNVRRLVFARVCEKSPVIGKRLPITPAPRQAISELSFIFHPAAPRDQIGHPAGPERRPTSCAVSALRLIACPIRLRSGLSAPPHLPITGVFGYPESRKSGFSPKSPANVTRYL